MSLENKSLEMKIKGKNEPGSYGTFRPPKENKPKNVNADKLLKENELARTRLLGLNRYVESLLNQIKSLKEENDKLQKQLDVFNTSNAASAIKVPRDIKRK